MQRTNPGAPLRPSTPPTLLVHARRIDPSPIHASRAATSAGVGAVTTAATSSSHRRDAFAAGALRRDRWRGGES